TCSSQEIKASAEASRSKKQFHPEHGDLTRVQESVYGTPVYPAVGLPRHPAPRKGIHVVGSCASRRVRVCTKSAGADTPPASAVVASRGPTALRSAFAVAAAWRLRDRKGPAVRRGGRRAGRAGAPDSRRATAAKTVRVAVQSARAPRVSSSCEPCGPAALPCSRREDLVSQGHWVLKVSRHWMLKSTHFILSGCGV
ncbi:Protein of unknown function, partial [Gryllus bimaculatus]